MDGVKIIPSLSCARNLGFKKKTTDSTYDAIEKIGSSLESACLYLKYFQHWLFRDLWYWQTLYTICLVMLILLLVRGAVRLLTVFEWYL